MGLLYEYMTCAVLGNQAASCHLLTICMYCRYEAEVEKGNLSEEEQKRQAAKDVLQRYTHYFDRCTSHGVAYKQVKDFIISFSVVWGQCFISHPLRYTI